ncbi:Gfo/Idh/MocA family protein [Viscerimonas tarda]
MENINWGIIGCGDVCEKKSGPALYKIDHSALVAVMRRDELKAQDFAGRHNVLKYYTDADELINDPDVNAIYVATPPNAHKEYAIGAMEAGKPVYVEKPMAMNYAECLDMIQASKKTGQKLFVAYYRRSLPYFLKVKEIIASGCMGDILCVDVRYYASAKATDCDRTQHTWRVQKQIAGGGYFHDMAPHTLDILDYFLGEIDTVKGYTANMAGLYAVEDTLSAIFRFKSGVLGTGQWCFVASKDAGQDSVTITGTKACVSFNTFSFKPIQLAVDGKVDFFEPEQPEHIQQPLIQTIVDELRGVGKCPSTMVSAARTSRIMDVISGQWKD